MSEKRHKVNFLVLTFLFFSLIAFAAIPLISAAVNITATVGNVGPTVGQIQICDGTCSLTKTVDPATALTIKVVVTDPNGQGDVNTESFRIELYTDSDLNGAANSWDHNNMNLITGSTPLGTANGCTQTGTTYCITLPSTTWTTKFLGGDANIFIRVDDNSRAQDSNSLSKVALIVNSTTSRSEDATTGSYSANPSTTNNAFDNGQTVNAYIISTHNGNVDINVTVRGIDLNVSSTVYIKDNNQSWYLTDSAASSTPFTGANVTVKGNFTRGTYPTSNTQNVYYWLDIPDQQQAGSYTSTLTYGSTAS